MKEKCMTPCQIIIPLSFWRCVLVWFNLWLMLEELMGTEVSLYLKLVQCFKQGLLSFQGSLLCSFRSQVRVTEQHLKICARWCNIIWIMFYITNNTGKKNWERKLTSAVAAVLLLCLVHWKLSGLLLLSETEPAHPSDRKKHKQIKVSYNLTLTRTESMIWAAWPREDGHGSLPAFSEWCFHRSRWCWPQASHKVSPPPAGQ